MPLLVGTHPTFEEFVSAVQVWAAQVDGVSSRLPGRCGHSNTARPAILAGLRLAMSGALCVVPTGPAASIGYGASRGQQRHRHGAVFLVVAPMR